MKSILKSITALILMVLLLLTCGCKRKQIKPYLSAHVPNSIVRIEVLHNKNPDEFNHESCYKIRELSKDEIPEFMHQLCDLEVLRVTNRHNNPGYGGYIAEVTYENGDVEMLGSRNITLISNGEAQPDSSWGFLEEESFIAILDQYVDLSPYIAAMQQLPEDVERIEILDTSSGGNKVLCSVEGDEILPFLSKLNELSFSRTQQDQEETQNQNLDHLYYMPPSSTHPLAWISWFERLSALFSPEKGDYELAAPLTLRVCYKDGYYDLLSTVPSSYHAPDGTKVETEFQYYLRDGNDLLTLLENFLGEENVPDIQYDS